MSSQERRENGEEYFDDQQRFDVQEEIKKRRLEEINETRRDIREVRKETKEWIVKGANPNNANEYLHEAVSSFLTELYSYRELAPEYWTGEERDKPLSQFIVSPPGFENPNSAVRGKPDTDRWSELPQDKQQEVSQNMEPTCLKTFWGLDDWHTHKTRYSHTWFKRYQPRNMRTMIYYTKEEYAIPRWTLLTGVEEAVKFARAIGFDLDIPDQTEWEI